MNYLQNYLLTTNNTTSAQGVKKVNNGVTKPQTKVSQNEQNVTELQSVQPDYNVRTPIAYTKLKDIKLNDDLTAKCYRLANGQKLLSCLKTVRQLLNLM